MGEYHLAPPYACRLFRSVDDGATWTLVYTYTGNTTPGSIPVSGTNSHWHGTRSAKVYGSNPNPVSSPWTADQPMCTLWTGTVSAVAGTSYYGQFRVRASKPGVYGSTIWFSSGRGSGTVVGGLGANGTNYHPFPIPNGDWFHVTVPPYTADAQDDGTMSLFIAVYHISGQEFELYFDGVGIATTPGAWAPVSDPRAAESLRDTVRTPSSWTHTMVISPQAVSTYLKGSDPYYLGTYYVNAAVYAEVYFDPTDDTFAIRSTVGGAASAVTVKTPPRYFVRHQQIVVALTSSPGGLTLTVLDGAETVTATNAAFSALNSTLVTWRSGGMGAGQQLPGRYAESRWYEGARQEVEIAALALT
ncbi:MAG: hypothetical protein ACO1SV_20910 [Fimbriimonas sp.]